MMFEFGDDMVTYALSCMSDEDAKDCMGGDLAPALKDTLRMAFSVAGLHLRGHGGEK